jgi:hypothetical protein
MSQLTQINANNLPNLYANNLQLSWLTTTTLSLAAGQARDSTNNIDITLSTAVTLNGAVNGANGLDTGSLANATWYAIHLIGSSTNTVQPAVMASTSATAPLMPAGYDSFRRIGWALTDGSAHFLKFYVYGNSGLRKYFWDAVITELAAGASATFADVNLASSVPPTSTLAVLNWKLVPATAGNISNLRVNGSSSVTNIQLTGSVAAQPNTGMVTINTDTSQIIEYLVGNASDALTLYCAGFEDFI